MYREQQGETVGAFKARLVTTAEKLSAGVNLNPHKGDPLSMGGDLPWYFPHNLLTPDGKWHEIGATGWFGARNDDMSELEWVQKMILALDTVPDTDAVYYLDLHI